ncbi:lipopolysaccharide biosynthesis protein [Vibrio splendidus]
MLSKIVNNRSAILALIFFISKGISFLVLPVYSRLLSPEVYGQIESVMTIVNVAVIFGVFQLDTSIQRFYYEDTKIKEQSILLIIVLTLIVSCILYILSDVLLAYFNVSTEYGYILSIGVFLINLHNIILICTRFDKDIFGFSVICFMQILLSTLFSVTFISYSGNPIELFLIGQLLGYLISILFVLINRKYVHSFTFDRQVITSALRFSIPQFPARVMTIFNTYLSRVFLAGLVLPSMFGIYSMSLKLSLVVQIIISGFGFIWWPYIYKNTKLDIVKPKIKKAYFFVSLFVLVATFSTSEIVIPLLHIMLGGEYHESIHYFLGLTISLLFLILHEVTSVGPKVSNKTSYITYSYLLSFIFSVVATYPMISYFGLDGAVFVSLCASVLIVLSSSFYLNKSIKLKINYYQMLLTLSFGVFIYINSYLDLLNIFGLLVLLLLSLSILWFLENYTKKS